MATKKEVAAAILEILVAFARSGAAGEALALEAFVRVEDCAPGEVNDAITRYTKGWDDEYTIMDDKLAERRRLVYQLSDALVVGLKPLPWQSDYFD